jgi:hypothetical protein
MRLLATALIAALPGFVFAQEVAGTTVIDGREVTLYANGTWEFATRREGSCALIARNVEFCGENAGWEPTQPPNADIAATYRFDDRHYGQMIIEELGSRDGLTNEYMMDVVIENAAAVIGGRAADVAILENYRVRVGNQTIPTIVYAFNIDGLDVVYANGIRTAPNRTMQLMTFSIGTEYTERHRELHDAFLSEIRITK